MSMLSKLGLKGAKGGQAASSRDRLDENRDNDFAEAAESITGSSAGMSPESIVATQSGAHELTESVLTDARPAKTGLLSGGLFSGLKRGSKAAKEAQAPVGAASDAIVRDIGARPAPLPVIGGMRLQQQYGIGLAIVVLSLVVAGTLAFIGVQQTGFYQQRAEIATRITMLSQRTASSMANSVDGDVESLNLSRETRAELEENLGFLVNGNAATGLPGLGENDVESLARLNKSIKAMLTDTQAVIGQAAVLTSLRENAAEAERITTSMVQAAEQIQAYFIGIDASPFTLSMANNLTVLSYRLRHSITVLLTSSSASAQSIGQLNLDFRDIRLTLDALLKGEAAVTGKVSIQALTDPLGIRLVTDMRDLTNQVNEVVKYVADNGQQLVRARRSLQPLISASDESLRQATALASEMTEAAAAKRGLLFAAGATLLVTLFGLGLLAFINNRSTRIDAWDTAYRNKKNETDIITFMEAILPLEMGDLTARFTDDTAAMEGITGGIRSSVNEAVNSLRDAVDTVKGTTSEVTNTVEQSVSSSHDLDESNRRQVSEIGAVVERVGALTLNIDQVTENTQRAAGIMRETRSASDQGVAAVEKTNAKMTQIRGNMQDVLKSVKHLGETSHEIGTIVEAIEKITDRTQVIAVNASLEAAKAGAAGQGFQVLAGEVNRLAEQSNDALSNITALVQRIQGETAGTIRTVEESAENVVEGTALSEAANTELTKISELAEAMYRLMETVRSQSEAQSKDAGEVRASMTKLQELSSQFQSSVQKVVGGVQKIEASMGTLKSTVSIFTTEKAEPLAA